MRSQRDQNDAKILARSRDTARMLGLHTRKAKHGFTCTVMVKWRTNIKMLNHLVQTLLLPFVLILALRSYNRTWFHLSGDTVYVTVLNLMRSCHFFWLLLLLLFLLFSFYYYYYYYFISFFLFLLLWHSITAYSPFDPLGYFCHLVDFVSLFIFSFWLFSWLKLCRDCLMIILNAYWN
jgi:hypothetical protein